MNRVIVFIVSIVISGVVLTSLYTSDEEPKAGHELINKTGNCTVDNGMECWCLPNLPYLDEPDEPPLLTLLQMGDNEQKVVQGNSAVFLLGTSRAGTTTSAHVIAGNLSKLHSAYFSYSDELVIFDEEDKIGHPSQYPKCFKDIELGGDEFYCRRESLPKTVFPELLKNEDNFFDFPSINDVDRVGNFFMGEAVKNITEFKLLFIVPQTFLSEENVESFERFERYAIEFVNDIFKFKNSFGLVVTKVSSFNSRGKYIPDSEIVTRITGFLHQYVATLVKRLDKLRSKEDEYERNKRDKENILKKLALIKPLLVQDENGNYSRIWFIRRPTHCGSLNNMEEMHHARANITEMCTRLKPTIINKPLEEPVFNVVFHDGAISKIFNDSDWRSRAVTPYYHNTQPYSSYD